MSELIEGQEALRLATGFDCAACYDSGIVLATHDQENYDNCVLQPRRQITQLLNAIPRFNTDERNAAHFTRSVTVARALVRATIQRPVRAFVLAQLLGLDKDWQREVKKLIHTLRNEWHLPIGSSRKDPTGYYWISSPEDFLAWFEPLCSQARNELTTAYSLMRRHYPELAGQFRFDFEEEAATNDQRTDGRERP